MYFIKESIRNCTAKVSIFVGEKENRTMKISAKIIHENLPGSSLRIMEKMYHGDFSINHANDYVKEIYVITKEFSICIRSCNFDRLVWGSFIINLRLDVHTKFAFIELLVGSRWQ